MLVEGRQFPQQSCITKSSCSLLWWDSSWLNNLWILLMSLLLLSLPLCFVYSDRKGGEVCSPHLRQASAFRECIWKGRELKHRVVSLNESCLQFFLKGVLFPPLIRECFFPLWPSMSHSDKLSARLCWMQESSALSASLWTICLSNTMLRRSKLITLREA